MSRFKLYRWYVGGYWGKENGTWKQIDQGTYYSRHTEFTAREDHKRWD